MLKVIWVWCAFLKWRNLTIKKISSHISMEAYTSLPVFACRWTSKVNATVPSTSYRPAKVTHDQMTMTDTMD